MDWMKKHVDTVAIIGAIVISMLWMNGKFNEVDRRFSEVDLRFSSIDKDIAVMKTVLLMKGVMPGELCKSHEEGK